MAEKTGIEWCDHTFNPWMGCTAVSRACDHCYAKTLVERWGGDFATRKRTSVSNWKQPLTWNRKAEKAGKRMKVFCASLADVFDNQVPEEWRNDLWELIASTRHLDWLLLTKRPQNIMKMLPLDWGAGYPNVWLGTTAENQEEADKRIMHLLRAPAMRHFLSCEPMLSPINLTSLTVGDGELDALNAYQWQSEIDQWRGTSETWEEDFLDWFNLSRMPTGQMHPVIDWVICGGESGHGARPTHPDWVRSLRDQCTAAGVPFFMKQWGEWVSVLDREKDDPDWRATYYNPALQFGNGHYRTHNLAGGMGFHGESVHLMKRVGKKAAAALLDGIEHKAFPA